MKRGKLRWRGLGPIKANTALDNVGFEPPNGGIKNRPTILKSCTFSPDRGENALNRINFPTNARTFHGELLKCDRHRDAAAQVLTILPAAASNVENGS
jgi:hypothetical protein